MSFPKGPRFAPEHVNDVPGPGSYNLCQESQLDVYKRGAFLEKADRFSKDAPSEVPGPGAYNTGTGKPDSKPNAKPPANLGDRYAILQRKVEDLERIHNDGKKAHQTEVERLKLELSRSQKTNAENSDRLEKQKKQNVILEARIQDLKKTASTEQGELKDLRVKLRMSEHERTQLAGKQGEAGDLRKALQSLESRRRDEVRERDRAIADLEKSIAAEKKRREVAEARLQELQGRGNAELGAVQTKVQSLQAQLTRSQEETEQAAQSLAARDADASAKQSSLLDQLERHRLVLLRAAEEYGRLAAETVSATLHAQLKHEHGVLQMRTWRVERKLANAESQLKDIVNLIHNEYNTKALLECEIRDLREECDFYRRMLPDRPLDIPQLGPLYDALATAMRDLHEEQLFVSQSDNLLATNLAEFYRRTWDELSAAYLTINAELDRENLASRDLRVQLSGALEGKETLEAEFANVQEERNNLANQLATAERIADELKTSAANAEQQSAEIERKLTATTRASEAAASNNKKVVQQLTETVKKSRMAEEGLRAEIEILTTELAESDQFQAAYYSLSDEIKSLIARKELAEGEAEQLSRFNAEILGHQNPAQRIMYVDRIRREMAEIKHKLALTETECESVASQNTELIRELQMYKSVSVPVESKPRTIVTRISRPPLVPLNSNTPAVININRELKDVEKIEDFSFAI
ncbi:hypothetical protein DFH08DRAFT_193064 [Mycena albidolilacea]|uniref:Uncharacterized protein n=1 Tax=Mycena albidolilacea TaxID=1033008 RepID=A0AAD7A0H6_9AGAR|nr:hypothetical protein DFH08DRAFT_193064 [Mycena albidolilacea]